MADGCCGLWWGDKMSDANGNLPLTLFFRIRRPMGLGYMDLSAADASAFVGAYARSEVLRREGTRNQETTFVARRDGDLYLLDLIDSEGTWTLALTDNDLGLLGLHAQVGNDLSARELLSWRERYRPDQ